jgi:transposase InsO family protein
VAENLLDRDFTPTAPNQVWTSDITYLWTDEGWLYLAVVLDLFNREVVGWSLKPRMTVDIVTDALTMAWFRRRPAPGLVHHSDRGSQYASQTFQAKLTEYGMTGSMSRKGNCWDNAPTESWFNSFKNERVHGVRFETRAEMKAEGVRVHRGVLQPEAPSLNPRLQVTNPLLAGLADGSAKGKTGSMNPARWKTKNRGNLTWRSTSLPSVAGRCAIKPRSAG